MYKKAKILTKLQPHQQAALKRALAHDLILAHSTGSGKTLTSIAIADALGKPTTVLTPASLVENYKKELLKHKKGGPRVDVFSLPTAVSKNIPIPKGNTVILDEAHSIRNEGTARQAYVKKQLQNAGRVIALTGTPAYNRLEDWAPLVNIVARGKVVPEDFAEQFIGQNKIDPGFFARVFRGVKPGVTYTLKNRKQLRELLHPYVDVFDKDIEKPERIDETISVPLDDIQRETYSMVSKDIPKTILWKLRNNLPPNKAESKDMNAFFSGVRQVSNTAQPYTKDLVGPGSKLRRAVEELGKRFKENPRFRALVYSNYLDSGINPYAELLDKESIPYAKFNGAMTPKQKKEVVDNYNSGKIPVILGSGSASEGLDLQGTRLIQILEPHFNDSKIDQVTGRGIRYKSHSNLTKEERNVLVQKYLSTLPDEESWFGLVKTPVTSIDEYLTSRSKEKQELINQAKEVLK